MEVLRLRAGVGVGVGAGVGVGVGVGVGAHLLAVEGGEREHVRSARRELGAAVRSRATPNNEAAAVGSVEARNERSGEAKERSATVGNCRSQE